MNQKQILRKQKLIQNQEKMKGYGMFIYENNTSGDIYLPRPTATGQRLVGRGKQFVGDSFYHNMIGRELKLIRTIKENVNESDNRLLTEQPPVVTEHGQVEFVQAKKQFNEEKEVAKDILLTESPFDGVKIIR